MKHYLIYKFGGRWICDGPNGRFHARTKQEAERLLTEQVVKLIRTKEAS